MSFSRSLRGHHSLNQAPPLAEKITDEPITSRTAQSTVTCVYMANISGYWRKVTVTWCKNLMSHFFNIAIQSIDGDFHCHTCKIDLKPWHFWSKKGFKSFEIESNNSIDVYWDLRSAKFSAGPEPCTDFYVALICDDEVVLLIGDIKKKAYKRTKSRPALIDAVLFYKKENVFAKRTFSTRAKFDERKKAHEIVVESSTAGPKDPEMWISVDGIVVIHVKNLQWKFRGNQTVVVGGNGNSQTVQVFWDVHDWLFGSPGNGHGLFIFKPGIAEIEESEMEDSGHGSENGSLYYSTISNSNTSEFCLFLHAWKIE
ncbi:hypothetical protein CsatB_020233 [Cannabis sativa]|uniref:DUF868 domain-containing protein n=2 Tax=Cannabis sativa TaxID=3483 RepID=A0A7J6GHG2_CANSA|nr:uncharacterized protein LOC115698805 [Cannabis sativa]KAF4360042.1 hypothetical protein G4B88_025803 [Cannabis sativa]KAF4381720.1 hypothetical protein F8388_021348 [Cannabis sativa]